ncbi:hypothetical protein HN832_03465 [archaeon]|jgi:hypothetical protein|nr:hypothetical protein [archaeon]MBT4373545.1 hypothetical protein [archaeon]MBT4531993.1 hypothetical protein [archaeon]MBT7001660.1 hypothetical protein [archaeon]MBT7282448.1 hypothetical protein [archaeon]
MVNLIEVLSGFNPLPEASFDEIIIKSIFTLAIIIIGVFFGKLISYGLKNLSKKLELHKHIQNSFIGLILVFIRWSIYLLFLNLALKYLDIKPLTNLFSTILITVPAFVTALLILTVGFALAIYLRGVIEDAEVTGWDLISRTMFYFVLYVFGIYALRVALVPFSESTINSIILILTAVISASVAYAMVKKGKIEHIKELK